LLWDAPAVGPAAGATSCRRRGRRPARGVLRVRGRRATVEAAPGVFSGAEGGIAPLGSSSGVKPGVGTWLSWCVGSRCPCGRPRGAASRCGGVVCAAVVLRWATPAVVTVESGSAPLWAAPACGPRAARGWPWRRRGSRRPRCRARGRRSGRASWARWAPCCSGRGDRADDGDGPRAAPAAPRAACRGSRRPWGGVEAVSLGGHRCEVCVGREADRAGGGAEPRGGTGVRAGRRGRGRLCGSRRS